MSVDPQTQRLFDAIAATNYFQVKRALAAGAALDRPNAMGQTPLAAACQHGNREIIDLLIAIGAPMQVSQTSVPASSADVGMTDENRDARSFLPLTNLTAAAGSCDQNTDLQPAGAAVDREVSYEQLSELIHQPQQNATEIDRPLIVDAKSLPPITRSKALDWQAVAADPEATYTFDLDGVFADRQADPASSSSVAEPPDDNGTIYIDLDEPIEEGGTIYIDLDPSRDDDGTMFVERALDTPLADDDDGTMFVESEQTITSLSAPVTPDQVRSDATYSFDLGSQLELMAATPPVPSMSPAAKWQDDETYVIGGNEADGRPIAAIEIDDIADVAHLLQADDRSLAPSERFDEGETYAVDLDDLDDLDLAVSPAAYSLTDLDSSLFPSIGSDDDDSQPDFDADVQPSTDIFGQSKNEAAAVDEGTQTHSNEHFTNTSLIAALADGDIELAQEAIEAGANLDRFDWHLGYTPLGLAIERGYTEIVRCLLDRGANPHSGSTTTTALGLAAESGATDIPQLLLPRGIDINEPVERDGWTALLSAIKNGHKSVVQLLVTAGAKVNIWSRGETPILLAAKCEDREIYNYLYPLVDTEIRFCADRDGERLLQSTRKRRIREQNRPIEKFVGMAVAGDIEEVKRAINIGIEIDELGSGGYTALMAAAYYGHKKVVKTLLEAGANPNLLSDDDGLGMGMTALMLVAGSFFAHNRQAIVKLLLSGGADVNQQGTRGRTAIFYAALAGSGYRDCVETLIAAGANLDLRDDRGHTVLTAVAAAENYPLLNLLIQSGVNTTGLMSVQLIQAATAGNVERVRALLSERVNLNLERGAAIGSAAAAGHTEIVELLIRAGANVNLSNRAGFTPLASAAYAGHGEIVRLLIEAGADIQAPASDDRSYSALEYAQMGLYQYTSNDRQHARIIEQLEQLERL